MALIRRFVPIATERSAAKPMLSARPRLLAVGASDLQPKLDDLHDIDRKQHGVKKKHGIKLSCNPIEDE
jgi:hypothetical protein